MSQPLKLIINSLQSRNRVYKTHPVSLVICSFGFLAHFSFIFLFDYWGVPSLSYLNIFSSLLWAWAILEVVRGDIYRAVYIGTFEILLHAVFAMSVLGQDSGFDLYLWPLAAWLAYNPNIKKKFALIAGTASIVFWVLGRIYWSHVTNVPISDEIISVMLRVNAILAGIVFIIGIVSVRIFVDRQSELLSERAVRDELTGLYNRRYLMEFINRFEDDEHLDRRAYALLMADIDRFKSINDQYGHEIGDKVLISFSNSLQENVRKEDMVCRWGGEEFIILLPKCTLAEASVKAEGIRRLVADKATADAQSQTICITASFGVTQSVTGERFADVLARVDRLLYEAKESGRNRVVSR